MRGTTIHAKRVVQKVYKEMEKKLILLHYRRSHPNHIVHQRYVTIDLLFYIYLFFLQKQLSFIDKKRLQLEPKQPYREIHNPTLTDSLFTIL